MIVHCMPESVWNERRDKPAWGQRDIDRDGFIHCSPVAYFWRVAPNFKNDDQPLVLACIDENRLNAEVRYEDGGDGAMRLYPHVYGLIPQDAVTMVLPYLKDAEGNFIKNPELQGFKDE